MVEEALTLQDHLAELRQRLVKSVIFFLLAFVLSYAVSDYLISFLFLPVRQCLPPGSTMVFTSLTEGFMAYLKVSFWAAVVISAPFFFYQLWRFLLPALYEKEKRVLKKLLVGCAALFVFGGFFGYWVILPVILSLSMGYAGENLIPMPRLQNYLVFTLKSIFLFGLIFELPFLMAGVSRLGFVPKGYFKKNRKFAYIILFLTCALLVPTDFFSQLLLFVPMITVYEIGTFFAR